MQMKLPKILVYLLVLGGWRGPKALDGDRVAHPFEVGSSKGADIEV